MAAHEAGGDLQVLLLSGFTGAKDALDAAGVGSEVFFHEHVDALLDGVFEVGCSEGQLSSL